MGRIRIVRGWSDYLELSQFSYNLSIPLQSLSIPIRNHLIRGIRVVDLEMTKFIATHQALMEFYFKGGDLFQWFVKLHEFFALDNTQSHRMVSIASCYMEGEAWEWFQDVEGQRHQVYA